MKWQQKQKLLFKNTAGCIILGHDYGNPIHHSLPVGETDPCFMAVRHILVISDVQYAGFRKVNFDYAIFGPDRMFNSNGKTVFHHPDSDISIPFGLAFNMVEMSVNLDDRIGNYLLESLIMFIPQLYEVLALAIIRAKYLVDQGNQQIRHFLGNGPEHIIKDCVKTGILTVHKKFWHLPYLKLSKTGLYIHATTLSINRQLKMCIVKNHFIMV